MQIILELNTIKIQGIQNLITKLLIRFTSNTTQYTVSRNLLFYLRNYSIIFTMRINNFDLSENQTQVLKRLFLTEDSNSWILEMTESFLAQSWSPETQ